MATLKRTPEQTAIAKAVKAGKNFIVNAFAGTGKSSTIEDVAPKGSVILSFNRAIANEMNERLVASGTPCSASTFHSYGLKLFPRHPKIDNSKARWVSQDVLFGKGNKPSKREQYQALSDLTKAVSWCKSMAIRPDSDSKTILTALQDERFDMESSSPEGMVDYVRETLAECANQTWRSDYDDMQWLPYVNGWGADRIDTLFVDEGQDLNPIREQLALMWGNQIIGVGDEFQAIYAFQGSMSDSLARLKDQIDGDTLPLSVCWRCPSSHLDLARSIVKDIRNRPKCPKGTILSSASLPEALEHIDSKVGALIMCRVNAPLIRQFYKMRRDTNNPVVMVSGNIAETLCGLIGSKWEEKKPFDFDQYQAKMEKRIQNAKSESIRIVLQDHDMALKEVLTEHADKRIIGELHKVIHAEFDVPQHIPKNAIRLSSLHGAKGLEHHHTIFYGTDKVPHSKAEKQWELDQERNLKYVGYTRSKDTMDLIADYE
jgi:superfamily I DNA/RNA helicase